MPIYEYQCVKDEGHITDGWNKIVDRHKTPVCNGCGSDTFLILSPTRSNPDIMAFQSLGFDHGGMENDAKSAKNPTHFRSRRHFNEELKARNLAVAPKKQESKMQRDYVKQKRKYKEGLGVSSEWVNNDS